MMKKLLSLLLVLMLVTGTALAGSATDTDLEADDPYAYGAQEMLCQLYLRSSSNGVGISGRDSQGNGSIFGMHRPESYDGYPNGIILDRDNRCVLIAADECVAALSCLDGENAMEITAGYAVLSSYYCGNDALPDYWERKDGQFTQLTLMEANQQWIIPYRSQIGDHHLLIWSSLAHFDDPVLDVMGRIMSCKSTSCVINSWVKLDELTYEQVPDCIIIDETQDLILVQSRVCTYAFWYEDGCMDSALSWTIFHVLMGGVELYDMYVLHIDPECNMAWLSEDEINDSFDAFSESWYTMPLAFTLKLQ